MPVDPQKKIDDFEDFFEDVFTELTKFGEIEEMQVVDNLGDHLVGNVYVKYKREEDAARALQGLTGGFLCVCSIGARCAGKSRPGPC